MKTELEKMPGEISSLHEELAGLYIAASGKKYHTSDCATSCSPAERPGKCDCDAPDADFGLLVKQLRKGSHFTVDSMASLMREAATAMNSLLLKNQTSTPE